MPGCACRPLRSARHTPAVCELGGQPTPSDHVQGLKVCSSLPELGEAEPLPPQQKGIREGRVRGSSDPHSLMGSEAGMASPLLTAVPLSTAGMACSAL